MQYFKNGKIFGENGSFYEAMSIKDGKILWLGKNSEVKDAGAIDLNNAFIIPTFTDSHTHPLMVAQNIDRVPCLPPVVNSVAEMVEALKKSPSNTGNPDQWIEGYGWDENVFKEKRPPTCKDLDKVSTTQPILAYHSSYHLMVCNSKALEMANISKNTKDPEKGRIGRFENGEPNGIFYEPGAMDLIKEHLWDNANNMEGALKQLLKLARKYDKLGISSVSDMLSLFDPYDRLAFYQEAKKRGMHQKVVLYYDWNEIKKYGQKPLVRKSDEEVFIGGIKLFMDGSIAGATAFMKENYLGSEDKGMKLLNENELLEAVDYARKNKLQVAIHAMGDASIDFIIDVTKNLDPWLKDTPTIRIEHASIMSLSTLKTMKEAKMNYGICPQAIFLFAEYESYKTNLSDSLLKTAYGMKTDDEYVLTSLSSDAPATLWIDPENLYVSMQAAVNRISARGEDMNKKEAISVPKAIDMLSINGAKIMGLAQTGKLQVGYDASFQVLDKDIFTMPADKLSQVLPKEVYIQGKKVI